MQKKHAHVCLSLGSVTNWRDCEPHQRLRCRSNATTTTIILSGNRGAKDRQECDEDRTKRVRAASRARLLLQRDTGSGLAIMAATENARGKWEGGKEVAADEASRADVAACARTRSNMHRRRKKLSGIFHRNFDHFRFWHQTWKIQILKFKLNQYFKGCYNFAADHFNWSISAIVSFIIKAFLRSQFHPELIPLPLI